MGKTRTRRAFGAPRQLASGRWQARYRGPNGVDYKAPRTFDTKLDADGWLAAERRLIELDAWTPPDQRQPRGLTLRTYADRWWRETERRHKPRTRVLNRGYLDNVILPELGDVPLAGLNAGQVRRWFAGLDDYPTRNANAYSLLRTILNQAVDDELIDANPARIRKAASKTRKVEPVALEADRIRELSAAMPARWRALVLLAGFSGLRFGELVALRRRDLTLTDGECSVTVRRAATRVAGRWVVGAPKSTAALRTVPLPHELAADLKTHLEAYALPGRDGLVFPAEQGEPPHENTVRVNLNRAAERIGVGHMRFHDLRHSYATALARAGATLADHMTIMGHTSAAMSARYTHATSTRNAALVQRVWG